MRACRHGIVVHDVPEASAKSAAIDSGDDVIDRVYATLSHGADVVGAILGVDMSEPASAEPVPADRTSRAARMGAGATETRRQIAAAKAADAPPFQIIESIDAATGKPYVVITNGTISRDCPSIDYARAVLAALRAKGAR